MGASLALKQRRRRGKEVVKIREEGGLEGRKNRQCEPSPLSDAIAAGSHPRGERGTCCRYAYFSDIP